MIRIDKNTYISSFSEIVELYTKGYVILTDLRRAIRAKIIRKEDNEIKLYIDHESQLIDIFANISSRKVFEFGKWTMKYTSNMYWKDMVLNEP